MPTTNAISVPIAKFLSSNSEGLRNGISAVEHCTTNTHDDRTPRKVQTMIVGDSNQSSRWPRSNISWAQSSAQASAIKPIQSKRSFLTVVCPRSATQMQTSVRMAGGTIMKNTARQFHASVAAAPTMGPITGPNTDPTPHITSANGCKWRGKVASRIAWPSGAIGAPKAPCRTRAKIRVSRLLARPQRADAAANPATVPNIMLRQPRRPASQAVSGVTMAVAIRFSVMTQEISSCVADSAPRTCGSTRFATVMVMPNSMFAN